MKAKALNENMEEYTIEADGSWPAASSTSATTWTGSFTWNGWKASSTTTMKRVKNNAYRIYGNSGFSVPTLESLVKGGHEVLAVVTQPDKPKGRGKSVLMTPVKEKALELGIPVYQPVKVREPEFMEVLKGLDAEVFVVVAFGQILLRRSWKCPGTAVSTSMPPCFPDTGEPRPSSGRSLTERRSAESPPCSWTRGVEYGRYAGKGGDPPG